MKLKTLQWLIYGILGFSISANATVLWMGGEDIDFPNGSTICTSVGGGRTGYTREAVYACSVGTLVKSTLFPGGVVTSAWISSRINISLPSSYSYRLIGFLKSGTSNSLWIGTNTTDGTKVNLQKYDGTTWTELAASVTGTIGGSNLYKLDMQVINYGAAATVKIYVNASSSPAITYTGDVTAGGATNFDSVAVFGHSPYAATASEIVVSDTDTRQLSLVTLAPNAAGDLNQWTGAYTNVNPTTINDASYINDNTSADIFQCKMNALPTGTGTVIVQGVKVIARAANSGSGLTSLSVGVKTNATVNAPAAVAQQVGWSQTETYYSNNPVTVAPWTTTEINALQINLKSAP